MLKVENSGKGNCMYYAYSISLMYFLRAKNQKKITDDIFDKLGLEESQKIQLQSLLSKPSHEEFTTEEIKTIIEPILGKASRDLAAEHTKVEFLNDPQSTSLFTASKFGLEYYFKKAIQDGNPLIAGLIDHEFDDEDYTEAEIYRVDGMKDAMEEYALTILPEVVEELDKQWKLKEEEFNKQQKVLTASDISFHKSNILDNILRTKTISFFKQNENQYLDQYKDHIKREFVWGTEESLMILHRGIQGERFERNEKGTIDTFYETQIPMHLHRNDRSPFPQSGTPEMIVNNQGNYHWTSKIPETVFETELDKRLRLEREKERDAQLLREEQEKLKLKAELLREEQVKLEKLKEQEQLKTEDQIVAVDGVKKDDKEKLLETDTHKISDQSDEINAQTLTALDAIENGEPQATEGFVARMVNAIKTLWEGIKNIATYIGQKLGIVS